MRYLALAFSGMLLAGPAYSSQAAVPPKETLPPFAKASWIWRGKADDVCQFRTTLTLDEKPVSASLLITADNGYELYVNGAFLGADIGAGGDVWSSVERYDIKAQLTQGRNVIGIRGTDLGGIRGLVAAVRVVGRKQPALEIVTDASWQAALKGDPAEYSHPEYVEGPEWTNATVVGPLGMAPWGKLAWTGAGARKRINAANLPPVELSPPGKDFRWPQGLVFLGDDCSVYVPLRGDAWGVCFRVNGWSRAYTEFDLPCPSKIGRKLYALQPGPGAKPRVLFDAGTNGVIGSPSVSYDGASVYVAMARAGEPFFHIHRIPALGGPPQRLTDGPFHDIDPVELPDGRITFVSTRIGSFEEYHSPPSRALFVMNADGTGIHPITFTLIFDNEPKVMADGRIAFIRTDNFFDRAKVETRIEVIRPDGTDGLTEVGANVGADYGSRLRAFGYGSPAPLPDGRLAVISSRGNFICPPGGAEKDFHRLPGGLGDLAPLPDGRLLATVLRSEGKQALSDVIAVIDPRDNKLVPIWTSPNGSVHSPVFLGARPRPPVIPDSADRARSAEPGATGFLFCQNARFTTKSKADWQNIRAIRVLRAVPLTTRSSHSHIVHAGHETMELGTVPLAPDGSFHVEVPADVPLALQAVDAEGRSELNEMSWIYVRPGERRSCLGCHQPRQATPPFTGNRSLALRAPPLRLLGQGEPHRFRGNNSGVTGMMDLQFERFRETASLNRHPSGAGPLTTGRQEIEALIAQLQGSNDARKISAAQRLAIFRSHTAAPALADRLRDANREVRVAAALALAACGTRESVPPLLAALEDVDAIMAQAAAMALENLTGHAEPFDAYAAGPGKPQQVTAWRGWFNRNNWGTIERRLIEQLTGGSTTKRLENYSGPQSPFTETSAGQTSRRRVMVALGHIGGDAARAALRKHVAAETARNPYPEFVKHNRTDRFTFSADSPLNPRELQEAVRALGQLKDTASVPMLTSLLASNTEPRTANLFLAEAAIEALGRIGTPEAEAALIDTAGKLADYWQYVGWYSDHPALYACHASPLHARLIEALDAVGSTRAAALVPALLRSVPTDPDRALFPQNDDYENLVGRVVRRNGRGSEVVETCLALLGDPQARASEEFRAAITNTFAAWAGHPGPENRAAQILSLACRDVRYEPRIRAAFERFVARPEEPVARALGNPNWTPVRHWTLFYLARVLGNLADRRSVESLTAVLADNLNEARHGRPDPSQPDIHFLHLEYTPCWRAAAAWALGRMGDSRAVPALLNAVRNLDNAPDVRHAAAESLGRIADPASLGALQKLAPDYPEISTRRALLAAIDTLTSPGRTANAGSRAKAPDNLRGDQGATGAQQTALP